MKQDIIEHHTGSIPKTEISITKKAILMKYVNILTRLLVVFVAAMTAKAMGIIHFNDGETHNIDYTIKNSVYVDYGEAYAERQTIINLLKDGYIPGGSSPFNHLQTYNSSKVNISGGQVDRLNAYENSIINIGSSE